MLRSLSLQKAVFVSKTQSGRQKWRICCQAQRNSTDKAQKATEEKDAANVGGLGKLQVGGLGDLLGPIGITIGKDVNLKEADWEEERAKSGRTAAPSSTPVAVGPNGYRKLEISEGEEEDMLPEGVDAPMRLNSMTTEEWRAKYERDGRVDLWVEEEFNAGSRVVGGSYAWKGGIAGFGSGEGPTRGDVPRHRVKIYNKLQDQEFEVDVPEDRFILFEAEEKGLELPYACRLGCCTACAVKVKEGEMWQPHALGISRELKEQGYALMCVGYPMADMVLEVADEDEVYDLQFGRFFEEQALDPTAESVVRDDYAIELALLDE